MVRAVIFDCFGVLIGTSYLALSELCPVHKRQELADVRKTADYGYIDRQEYVSQVARLIGATTYEADAMINEHHARNESMLSYVRDLRSRGIKTALLSNVGRGVMERIFTFGELNELFDVVTLSYEVGMVKPDPNIYRATVEKLCLDAADCLMVDDREEFCAGADAAGLQTLHFLTNASTKRLVEEKIILGY
ncbi:MAG: HAD-IA family hydrolase [Candidatus Saccharimonadales bacterium]